MLYQRISACLAQSRWGIQNKEALSATACYTTLRAEVSALDMAFIADKLAWESRVRFLNELALRLRDRSQRHATYMQDMERHGQILLLHP